MENSHWLFSYFPFRSSIQVKYYSFLLNPNVTNLAFSISFWPSYMISVLQCPLIRKEIKPPKFILLLGMRKCVVLGKGGDSPLWGSPTSRRSVELRPSVRSNRPKASVTYLVTILLFLSNRLFLMYSLNLGISGIHGQSNLKKVKSL